MATYKLLPCHVVQGVTINAKRILICPYHYVAVKGILKMSIDKEIIKMNNDKLSSCNSCDASTDQGC